ncbi:MAG TPA: radical SAM protein [Elusimicrobiales bacterium]|nr:radical SAM protein [Elusimicrobiales bacterium]
MDLSFKKVVLVPGYQCNNRCVFCINSGKRGLEPRGSAEVRVEIKAAAARGCNYLEFAGGENTIRPDFCALVRCARDAGFKKIAVATNGRMFSIPAFAKAAVDSGLTEIIFSIHGHKPALHDGLTGVRGSFRQLQRGIENVRKHFKGTFATNTAVTRRNFRSLPEIGRFIAEFGFKNSEFIYADPTYGGVKDNFAELMPRISECAPYMRACLDIAADWPEGELGPLGYNWSARYVPLCHFQKYYPRQVSEAREVLIYNNVQHVAPDYVNMDAIKGRQELGRAKPPKCLGCALYSRCEGIWREYLKVYGAGELRPVKKKPAA